MRRLSTSMTITDPLVKYNTLISTGILKPDHSQHRLAIHLQKIYHRLKDYSPSPEYATRLHQLTNAIKRIEQTRRENHDPSKSLSVAWHPIRRNPLFSAWFSKNEPGRDATALVRVLTGHQGALEADSPQGLFLSGEVGTGKSMLLDILSEGLPTTGKRRWHFNTFMLHAFSQIEQYRKLSMATDEISSRNTTVDADYSLIWVAKNIIEKSPILFLDEFQLPDRTAAKIITNLFTAFFQLGGVLVASSNRMPEDLENAIGTTFTPPISGGIISQLLDLTGTRKQGELFGSASDFSMFLEVLKARCEFWHMEGGRDWRRCEYSNESTISSKCTHSTQETESSQGKPSRYHQYEVSSIDDVFPQIENIVWTPSTLIVYGREVNIPRQHHGVCFWKFEEIVDGFGPADYISMASTYHTFFIDNVPILTLAKKNEARRFITLLDALYECRCKLSIRADAGPDELFFPDLKDSTEPSLLPDCKRRPRETKTQPSGFPSSPQHSSGALADADAIYSETFAEVYQDAIYPFRPNVSIYNDTPEGQSFDDEDMDFQAINSQSRRLDFRDSSAFTGEDEKFAYRRAASRLWEMCSERWHSRGAPERSGTVPWDSQFTDRNPEWWYPLPKEARHWELASRSKPLELRLDDTGIKGDASIGPSIEVEEPVGLERFWKHRT